MEAVRPAVLHWGCQWQGQTLCLYSDNSTTVAYIRKQGAPYSGTLFTKTVELLNLLDLHHINLTWTHLPESCKVTADALSRMNSPNSTEWRLSQETLNSLFCVLENPLVDMFATTANKVVPIFCVTLPGRDSMGGKRPINLLGQFRFSVCFHQLRW